MRLVIAAGCALVATGLCARADMYPDGSNAKLPQAHANLGITSGCDPVAAFGADPTGVADATAAINQCATMIINGQRSNISLPAGNYRVNGQIDLSAGQSLTGAGRGTSVLRVDQAFNPSATGVIVLSSGALDPGPEVRDIGIRFAQPDSQNSRAAFQNLGTCTSGAGGTGCKYPPAILLTSQSYRPKIRNVRIARAWKGVVTAAGAQVAPIINTLEVGALDTGLQLDYGLDWMHMHTYHFWPFEINTTMPIYNVVKDGSTIAAKFGSVNGANVTDMVSLHGRIIVDGAAFWGDWTNVNLDSVGGRLEIIKAGQPGLRITNMYTSGAAGTGSDCKVDIKPDAYYVQITQAAFQGGETVPGEVAICAGSNGHVTITNSYFLTGANQASIRTTGFNWLELSGNKFLAENATVPLIDVQGGAIRAVNNHFPFYSTNVGSIRLAADSANHYIADNNTDMWPVVWATPLSGATPISGYYDLNQRFSLGAVAASFQTPGDSVFTTVASGGLFYLRGNFVEGGLDATLAANAYTTASGPWRVKVANMPPPVPNVPYGCHVPLVTFFVIPSVPTCDVDALGFSFYKVNSGAAATPLSTAEFGPGRQQGLRIGWRYLIR